MLAVVGIDVCLQLGEVVRNVDAVKPRRVAPSRVVRHCLSMQLLRKAWNLGVCQGLVGRNQGSDLRFYFGTTGARRSCAC